MKEYYCKVNEQPSALTGIPEVDEVLSAPSVHNQTKDILREAFKHDIVDSCHDTEYALHIITQVVDKRLAILGCHAKQLPLIL